MQLIEITDEAIVKLLEQQKKENFKYIRLGITGGGCAGFEYIFDSVSVADDDDIVIDYGKLKFVVNKMSVPYINGMTLDFRKEGLNELFLTFRTEVAAVFAPAAFCLGWLFMALSLFSRFFILDS